MAADMKESSEMIKNMDRAYSINQMVVHIRESLEMIN